MPSRIPPGASPRSGARSWEAGASWSWRNPTSGSVCTWTAPAAAVSCCCRATVTPPRKSTCFRRRPPAPPRLLVPRVAERELEVAHLGDAWLLRVNDTGPNFRVVRFAEGRADPERWQELLPHRDDVMVEGLDAFAGYWVAWERTQGLTRIRVTERAEGRVRYVGLPEPVYEAGAGPNAEWESGVLRYEYESPVTPPSVFDYDVAEGTSTLRKQREVPGGFDASR